MTVSGCDLGREREQSPGGERSNRMRRRLSTIVRSSRQISASPQVARVHVGVPRHPVSRRRARALRDGVMSGVQLLPARRHRVAHEQAEARLDDAADLDGQARAQRRDAQDPDARSSARPKFATRLDEERLVARSRASISSTASSGLNALLPVRDPFIYRLWAAARYCARGPSAGIKVQSIANVFTTEPSRPDRGAAHLDRRAAPGPATSAESILR